MVCKDCGLFDSEKIFCYRYNKEVERGRLEKEDCLYFYKIKKEDGEPLTPQEHLLMQDNELKTKKMRGPV